MRIDYELVQGDTLNIDIEPVDDLDQPFDLSGFSAEVALEYVNAAGAVARWSASTATGGVTIAAGVISCAVPPAATALIPADRRCSYQLRLTDPAGARRTAIEGLIAVRNSSFS